MSKTGKVNSNSFINHSPDYVFNFYKDRTRQKLHLLKAKLTQYYEKNLPANKVKNITLQQIAQMYLKNHLKNSQEKDISQKNSENQEQNYIENLNQQEIILNSHSLLNYQHKNDEGKKWKINFNENIQIPKDTNQLQLLATLLMFSQGYFPFQGKKQSKSKLFVKYLGKLKKRPSRMIETFKVQIGQYWLIFSWTVQKVKRQIDIKTKKEQNTQVNFDYIMCTYLHSMNTQINFEKIDYSIDQLFQKDKYIILPGQTKYQTQKIQNQEQIFRFHDKNFKMQNEKNQTSIRKILPCKVSEIKNQQNTQSFVKQVNVLKNFNNIKVQIKKDHTNYDSVRYIYKQLAKKTHFNYSLSSGEFDVLQSKGNLIVIGRSGTGKTTCGLLRLFFKQLGNQNQIQRNVFLTASSVLISQIAKKYNKLSQQITKIHQYDYFNKYTDVTDQTLIKKFIDRLNQVNESFKRKKFNNFLSYKIFPCFLTIRQYIQSIDAVLENPFFNIKKQKIQNQQTQQNIIQYPDQIQWDERIIKKRKVKNLKQNIEEEQNWYQIDYQYFSRKIWQLPQIKKISCFSPQILWSEIFSTIKGSSRAHSFYHKFLDFPTYCKQSKNQFLELEDKRNVYALFQQYEGWKQKNNQYDLLDVVNNILIQLNNRSNKDLEVTSLFIDEVQDFPPSFIFLTGKIVQQSLFFSGDTAQTISKGVRFSFSDITEQFSSNYFQNSFALQKPVIKPLYENFRSQNQIIQLSNCLIRILQLMFPQSIDRMPFEISPNKGMKPLVMKLQSAKWISQAFKCDAQIFTTQTNNIFGADKAIIVRSKNDKKSIPSYLQNMTCLTYQQCKGLQYEVVILYNFFTSKKVQWGFLKHLELQRRSNNEKELTFNKSKFGSNKKLYFDLCSQLKILYTIMTRPKSILLICDDNIPHELERVWNYFGLVNRCQTYAQYIHYQKQVNVLKITGPKDRNKNEYQDTSFYFSNINQKQVFSSEKFKKQWAQEGFKMFFQRKNYQEAVKCFSNINLSSLAQISSAYMHASKACYETKSQTQKQQSYISAAKIFLKNDRIFQASKCFYLGKKYKEALLYFRQMGIKKYQAQCLWKLHYYLEAQQLFLKEGKYLKSFEVLIDSKYWFLFLSRLSKYSFFINSKNQNSISNGIQQCLQNLFEIYSNSLINNDDLQKISQIQDLFCSIILRRHGDIQEKINRFFQEKHKVHRTLQTKFGMIDQQNLKIKRQKGQFYRKILNYDRQNQIFSQLIIIIMYSHKYLTKYNILNNYTKYTLQNFGFNKQHDQFDGDLKILVKGFLIIFKTFESFGLIKFILYLSKCLKLEKIQELVFIQNFLRINQHQIENKLKIQRFKIHEEGLQYIEKYEIISKLSILVILFGKNKMMNHFFEQEDTIFSIYTDSIESDIVKKKLEIRIPYTTRNHNLIFFKDNQKERLNKRGIFRANIYEKLFMILDDLCPNFYYQEHIKQKQFIKIYQLLNSQQQQQLKNRIKVQVQKPLIDKKKQLQYLKQNLKKTLEQKQKIFTDTSKQQVDAIQKKFKHLEYIKKYVYLPQQCEKFPYRTYQLKMDIQQIKRQRNRILNQMDAKTDSLIKEQEQNIKTLDHIESLMKQKQIHLKLINKIQQDLSKLLYKIEGLEKQKNKLVKNSQQFENQILNLKSQKNGTNRKDKKLNQRIKVQQKNAQPFRIEIKQINLLIQKQKNIFNQNLNQKSTQQAKIVNIKKQILEKKHYICRLGLGKINQQTGQLTLLNSKNDTQWAIGKKIKPYIKKLMNDNKEQKDKIKYSYNTILYNVQDYIYYHKKVPITCLQQRQSVVEQIKQINEQIDQLQTEIGQNQHKITIKVKQQFLKQHFQIHCQHARSQFIKQKLLKEQIFQDQLSSEFLTILQFFAKLTPHLKNLTTIQSNRINKLFNEILDFEQSSIQLIWFYSFWLFHGKQLQLLKKLVEKDQLKKFYDQLLFFVQNLFSQDEYSQIVKKIFIVHGIYIVESYDDDLKYLQGFSIIRRKHNFYSSLKFGFIHRISSTSILVRTSDVLQVLKHQILKIINSTPLKEIMKFSQQKKYSNKFRNIVWINLKNQDQIKRLNNRLVNQTTNKAEKFQDYNQFINYRNLIQLKNIFSNFNIVLFAQIINFEENSYLDYQRKTIGIIYLLQKLIKLTKFRIQIDLIIKYQNQSTIMINGQIQFKNKQNQKILLLIYQEFNQKMNEIIYLMKQQLKNDTPIEGKTINRNNQKIDHIPTRRNMENQNQRKNIKRYNDRKNCSLRKQQKYEQLLNKNKNKLKLIKKQQQRQQQQNASGYILNKNQANKVYFDVNLGHWTTLDN